MSFSNTDSSNEVFGSAVFIGHPDRECGGFSLCSPAPLFRKRFIVREGLTSATLTLCALGMGKFYFNGKELTKDLFISPYGNYDKTVWYNRYDVTDKLFEGENLVAAALGNGFYNESLSTAWNFDKAPWRDERKFLFCLQLCYGDDREYVLSDTDWLCERALSPYRFDELRMGEIYDCNFSYEWMKADFDDNAWVQAVAVTAPEGRLRLCTAEPIREAETFECTSLTCNEYGEWVFDFGQNISGYIRLRTKQPRGTRLHIVYAEQLDGTLRRKDNKLSSYYPDGETQFSEVISGVGDIDWRPDFSYYGFRYVIISGFVSPPSPSDATAIFVHQNLEERGTFGCSDELLNKIYKAARIATLSNSFNMLTDCPTREKLGWCNDAQASCEQTVQNYNMVSFYRKWMQDIFDAQNSYGDLPGIVPTPGWGYEWGNGPVSTGILFEIPYRILQYHSDSSLLCDALPYMLKHLDFLDTKRNAETRLIEHGLDDWAGPWEEDKCPVPLGFICTALYIKFCGIARLAARLSGDSDLELSLEQRRQRELSLFRNSFLESDGKCRICEQTALSLIIVNRLYTELEPIKQQLIKSIEAHDFHFHVGMLGMQYILPALDICSLNGIAYKLLTASGQPSYRSWFEDGATSLHEMFGDTMSCNHHMYSCVIAWFHNSLLGIRHKASDSTVTVRPCFVEELSHASGCFKTDHGSVAVEWKRTAENSIELCIELAGKQQAVYESEDSSVRTVLHMGKNIFLKIKEVHHENS